MSGSNLDERIQAFNESVGELMAAGEKSGPAWNTPRAAGKWSPNEIVEHVSIALEESTNQLEGKPSRFPSLPVFVRPIIKGLFFNRIIKTGKFPKARAPRALSPIGGAATPAEGRARLEAAADAFTTVCRARAAAGQPVESTVFGKAPVEDFVRFQELHTRHHVKQMPERA